jgi:hypothetical protein
VEQVDLPPEQVVHDSGEHPVHGCCEVNGSAGRSVEG